MGGYWSINSPQGVLFRGYYHRSKFGIFPRYSSVFRHLEIWRGRSLTLRYSPSAIIAGGLFILGSLPFAFGCEEAIWSGAIAYLAHEGEDRASATCKLNVRALKENTYMASAEPASLYMCAPGSLLSPGRGSRLVAGATSRRGGRCRARR